MTHLLITTFLFFQTINPAGKTVENRFNLPVGYQRVSITKDSFGAYLRDFPLKEDKSKVYFYNGQEKTNAQQVAVLDIDRGTQDPSNSVPMP